MRDAHDKRKDKNMKVKVKKIPAQNINIDLRIMVNNCHDRTFGDVKDKITKGALTDYVCKSGKLTAPERLSKLQLSIHKAFIKNNKKVVIK